MSKRKIILIIDFHTDDDTGTYEIGEIDFGISGLLNTYLEDYGSEGMENILLTLSHLTWVVKERYFAMQKENEHKALDGAAAVRSAIKEAHNKAKDTLGKKSGG